MRERHLEAGYFALRPSAPGPHNSHLALALVTSLIVLKMGSFFCFTPALLSAPPTYRLIKWGEGHIANALWCCLGCEDQHCKFLQPSAFCNQWSQSCAYLVFPSESDSPLVFTLINSSVVVECHPTDLPVHAMILCWRDTLFFFNFSSQAPCCVLSIYLSFVLSFIQYLLGTYQILA